MIIIALGFVAVFITSLAASWKGFLISIGIVFLLSLIPFEGFKQPECVETIELIKLRRKDERVYYIRKKGNKVIFAYDNRDEYDLYGEVYEEEKIRGNIKIYESEDCNRPLLKVYKTKPSREILAVALFLSKTKYIFYVPMGTVLSKKTAKVSATIEDDIPKVL